jgi:hypothetical protein
VELVKEQIVLRLLQVEVLAGVIILLMVGEAEMLVVMDVQAAAAAAAADHHYTMVQYLFWLQQAVVVEAVAEIKVPEVQVVVVVKMEILHLMVKVVRHLALQGQVQMELGLRE